MVSAGAETVYEPEPSTIPDTKPKPKPTNNSNGGSSEEEAESSEVPPASGGTEGDGGSTGGSSPEAGNDGGTGQSNQGSGSKGGGDLSQAEKVQPAPTTEAKPAKSTTAPADSGSSSPLVPILIAIAVLAAISIGAVVYRQKRQDGGPGGSISPNAS